MHAGKQRQAEHYVCTRLQPYLNASLLHRQHAAQITAATTLQAALRSIAECTEGQSQMESSRQHRSATLAVQAACRGMLVREACSRGLAARHIQASLRGQQVLRHRRAVQLACDALGFITKSALASTRYDEALAAATRVQAAIRAHSGRAELQRQNMREEEAAGCLRAACRQGLARRKYRDAQASVRQLLLEIAQQECRAREEQSAALQLQGVMRRCCGQAHGLSYMRQHRRESAAQVLQGGLRRILPREAHTCRCRKLLAGIQTGYEL